MTHHDGGTERRDPATDLRRALVEGLKRNGVLSRPEVESAFLEVPRHLFLPGEPLERAYSDEAIPTKHAGGLPISSSSQPAIMAIMLEQLGLEPGQRALEIGAGTGYNAALMARIVGEGGRVTTVDIDEEVAAQARERLDAAGYSRVDVVHGDGALGWPRGAPYDRIILTVGAWDVAPAWHEQLAPGGRLVLPLSLGGPQASIALERDGPCLRSLSARPCGFMRLRGPSAGRDSPVPLDETGSLHLTGDAVADVDPASARSALSDPRPALPTGVAVRTFDLWSSLNFWLPLREPALLALGAYGEVAASERLPWLLGERGKWLAAPGLTAPGGMAFLTRPPGHEPTDGGGAFELHIRPFGSDPQPANALRQLVHEWDRAGRPSTDSLRVRICPREAEAAPEPGAVVVEKRWTRVYARWG
jgi:protein-L-isoaspartate(D-aspartate) O-methyltransferase